MILAGLAAILGLVVSRAGVGLYRQRIPDGILPYWFDYSLNGALFAGLSVMTLAAVAVFAVWPALHASRTAVVAVLQDGGRSDTGRLAPRLGGAVLLAVQLGLATVLVAQTGVAALTGEESLPTDARLHDARVLTGAITLPASVRHARGPAGVPGADRRSPASAAWRSRRRAGGVAAARRRSGAAAGRRRP